MNPACFRRRPVGFRKGARVATYAPTDRIHEKAIRAAMARHGWRLVTLPTPESGPRMNGERAR